MIKVPSPYSQIVLKQMINVMVYLGDILRTFEHVNHLTHLRLPTLIHVIVHIGCSLVANRNGHRLNSLASNNDLSYIVFFCYIWICLAFLLTNYFRFLFAIYTLLFPPTLSSSTCLSLSLSTILPTIQKKFYTHSFSFFLVSLCTPDIRLLGQYYSINLVHRSTCRGGRPFFSLYTPDVRLLCL